MKFARVAIGLGAAVAVGVGVFGGQFAWHRYTEAKLQAVAEAASAAALAEAKSVQGKQREEVRRLMHDPDSAQFRNDHPSSKNADFWCGEVNGRNRMGGMVGFTRYTALLRHFGDEVEADVDFDPTSWMSQAGSTASAHFATQWSVFCTN